MINKFFAHSDSQLTVKEHCDKVAEMSKTIAEKLINHSNKTKIIQNIELTAKLHDIGKFTLQFQKSIGNPETKEIKISQKSKFRHNEIGWAFLKRYLKDIPSEYKIDEIKLDDILSRVFWHHGISNNLKNRITDILDTISDDDIDSMLNYLESVVGNNYIFEKSNNNEVPEYFILEEEEEDKLSNHFRFLIGSCVVSADRLVSSMNSNSKIDNVKIINSILNRKSGIKNNKTPYNGSSRFIEQLDIISKLSQKTTIIKAPAGFGKTLLGLINWVNNSDRKLIWVCPRNAVAESVYLNILEELKTFDINASCQLYLTGEVKKQYQTKKFLSGFDTDIIVTNIDNFLTPTVDNSNMDKLFLLLSSNVIFDEFHELVGKPALFSCFTTIMNVRHNMTSTQTLLLSATPISMNYLWDKAEKTLILPNEQSHYNAVHTKTFEIHILEESDIFLDKSKNNLIIYNSIKNSQWVYHRHKCDLLVHSAYEDEDKKNRLNKIYEDYNKKSSRTLNKINVASGPIIQSSFDISLLNLYESPASPEYTLQRIGRIERWGDYSNMETPTINIINTMDDFSENKTIEISYTRELRLLWFNYLKPLNHKKLTLDDLYRVYNDFQLKYKDKIKKFVESVHSESQQRLSQLYPIKFKNKEDDSIKGRKNKIKTAGSNKLRTTNNEIFFIAKKFKSSEYSNAMSCQIYGNDFSETFNETNISYVDMIKAMKSLKNDKRFDYSEILSNKKFQNIDTIRKMAKKSNTPYIRTDKTYHPVYGLIDIDSPLLSK